VKIEYDTQFSKKEPGKLRKPSFRTDSFHSHIRKWNLSVIRCT